MLSSTQLQLEGQQQQQQQQKQSRTRAGGLPIPGRLIAWCLQKQPVEQLFFSRSRGRDRDDNASIHNNTTPEPPNQPVIDDSDYQHICIDSTSTNHVPCLDESVQPQPQPQPRKYPPRRMLKTGVFAHRDFPPGCGPDQQHQHHNSPTHKKPRLCDNHHQESDHDQIRLQIKDALQLFDKSLASFREIDKKNAHAAAANELKRMNRWLNKERRVGSIPGIEIGDKFGSRAELVMVGLHTEFVNGIDMLNKDGTLLATCLVATDRYSDNDMGSEGRLCYAGQGGNPKVYNGSQDQRLVGGNLALWNSVREKNPVRVVRKKGVPRKFCYVYDGLYLVDSVTQTRGDHGNLVFKFFLFKINNQMASGRPLELKL